MNVHALDRPLRFGDAEQAAVVTAIEHGMRVCRQCGELYALPTDGTPDPGLCPTHDWEYRCRQCGERLERRDWGREDLCEWCKQEAAHGPA